MEKRVAREEGPGLVGGESSTMAGAASVIVLGRGPYGVDLLLDPDDPDDLLELGCSYAFSLDPSELCLQQSFSTFANQICQLLN